MRKKYYLILIFCVLILYIAYVCFNDIYISNTTILTSKKFKDNILNSKKQIMVNYAKNNKIKSLTRYNVNIYPKYEEQVSFYEEYTPKGSILKTLYFLQGKVYKSACNSYDQFDNLLMTQFFNGKSTSRTTYNYYENYVVTESQKILNDTSNFDTSSTEIKYDTNGYITERISKSCGKITDKKNFFYNEHNKLLNIKTWFRCGCVEEGFSGEVIFDYDTKENLTKISSFTYHGSTNTEEIEQFQYDSNNNLTKFLTNNSEEYEPEPVTYFYDKHGRIKKAYKIEELKAGKFHETDTYYIYDDICYYDFYNNENIEYDKKFVRIEYKYY